VKTTTVKSYEEIIDFFAAGTTSEAVVAFRPSPSVARRVAGLEDYLQLEQIMIMVKARARQHTSVGH
jgi:hypothetical protein